MSSGMLRRDISCRFIIIIIIIRMGQTDGRTDTGPLYGPCSDDDRGSEQPQQPTGIIHITSHTIICYQQEGGRLVQSVRLATTLLEVYESARHGPPFCPYLCQIFAGLKQIASGLGSKLFVVWY